MSGWIDSVFAFEKKATTNTFFSKKRSTVLIKEWSVLESLCICMGSLRVYILNGYDLWTVSSGILDKYVHFIACPFLAQMVCSLL